MKVTGYRLQVTGFTLVEMLVVIAVLSVLGVLILNIFTRTLRGSNKAQITSQIKQNGQSILEVMDKNIRGADYVVCANAQDLTRQSLIVVKGGIYLRYQFFLFPPVASANGYIKQDNPEKGIVLGSNPPREETDGQFIDRVCNTADPMVSSAVTITDTNPQSGVSVENGSFIQDMSAGFNDQVTIKFDLKPGVSAPAAVAGQIDPVNFQTTVQLR